MAHERSTWTWCTCASFAVALRYNQRESLSLLKKEYYRSLSFCLGVSKSVVTANRSVFLLRVTRFLSRESTVIAPNKASSAGDAHAVTKRTAERKEAGNGPKGSAGTPVRSGSGTHRGRAAALCGLSAARRSGAQPTTHRPRRIDSETEQATNLQPCRAAIHTSMEQAATDLHGEERQGRWSTRRTHGTTEDRELLTTRAARPVTCFRHRHARQPALISYTSQQNASSASCHIITYRHCETRPFHEASAQAAPRWPVIACLHAQRKNDRGRHSPPPLIRTSIVRQLRATANTRRLGTAHISEHAAALLYLELSPNVTSGHRDCSGALLQKWLLGDILIHAAPGASDGGGGWLLQV